MPSYPKFLKYSSPIDSVQTLLNIFEYSTIHPKRFFSVGPSSRVVLLRIQFEKSIMLKQKDKKGGTIEAALYPMPEKTKSKADSLKFYSDHRKDPTVKLTQKYISPLSHKISLSLSVVLPPHLKFIIFMLLKVSSLSWLKHYLHCAG